MGQAGAGSKAGVQPGIKPGVACLALLVLAASLAACGDKAKKPGQSLASVNGAEITVLQLNEELERANVPPARQEAARKQLLEALIDRQLLENEASKEKLDRDPKVLQAVERAKSLIVAQTYMQKRLGTVTRPTPAEVDDYFQKNPSFFRERKQFDLRELVLATADVDATVKTVMDSAKSLDDVAAWLDAHKIKYARTHVTRTSSDLSPDFSSKLLAMPKGQLFIVNEGERSLLMALNDVKDSPVTLEVASAQIAQFLTNKKNKEVSDAELARLRAAAKIEYLNQPAAAAGAAPAAAAGAPAAAAPEAAPGAAPAADTSATDRGVSGLK